VDDRIAGANVEVELVERDAAVVFEVLLDLDLDVVAREVTAKLIAIRAELVGNGREDNPNGHARKLARCLEAQRTRLAVYQHNKVRAATITGYIAPDFCTKIPQQNQRSFELD
jgi:hypothetical protein